MPNPNTGRTNPRVYKGSRRLFIGIVAVALAANLAYFLFLGSSGEPYTISDSGLNDKIMKAVALSDRKTVAVTLDSRLVLLEDGKPAVEKKMTSTVTDLSVASDKSQIYAGTNERKVFVFDSNLGDVGQFPVNGNVSGVDSAVQGKISVAYGIGQYTDKFWVGQFSSDGKADYKTKIGFDVTSLAAAEQGTFFGTADSRVGFLGPDGKEKWRTTLKQPITRLSLRSGDGVVSGDEKGTVASISFQGQIVWSSRISAYPITMLDARRPGHILVGDRDGNLYILDDSGTVKFRTKLSVNAVNEVIRTDDKKAEFLAANGQTISVHYDNALEARQQSVRELALTAVDLALAVAAAGTLIASVPVWRQAARKLGRRLLRSRTGYMLILPSIALIIVFNVAPTVMALFYSFTNFSLKEPLKLIGFDNFVRIGEDDFFWVGMWNMILILFTSIVKELTMPLLVAELIFWLGNGKLKYWFRTSFVLPSIVPGVVGILLWKMMYEPESGMINQLLGLLGLDSWKHAWLGEEKLAIWSIIGAGFPFVSIFAFLVFFGGLIGISRDIYDSSSMDGIGTWRRFWSIDLPLIRPQIRLILFFTFIGSIQGFSNIFIFTRGGPGNATYVPALQMYDQVANANFGYASAIGFVLAVFVLIGTIVNFRFSKQVEG